MLTIRRLVIIVSLVFMSVSIAVAQDSKTIQPQSSTQTVTATVAEGSVRFAAFGEATEMRLEIYSATGEQVFDSGFRKGAILDWNPQDLKRPLPDGSYLCVVTYRDLQSRLRQKTGELAIEAGQLSLRRLSAEQLIPAQSQALTNSRNAQAITAAEGEEALTILPEDAAAVALVTHDGQSGRVVSTTGGLSLRTGDFFGGKDKERMRITEDGKVGIGTDNPETMFDVAGAIRARGGIIFNDGTALTSTGRAGRINKSGEVVPNASGTGTQNFIAKWQETGGAGTLGDSGIFEAPNGFIGIGTTTPPHPFSVRRNGGTAGVHSVGELFVDRDNNSRSASLVIGTGGVFKWLVGMPYQSNGFQVFDLATNQSRFFVDPVDGNIGIGTTIPQTKLDVAGNIKTGGIDAAGAINATQYHISGKNVLIADGSNTFVGFDAGYVTRDTDNSFFGQQAGARNTYGGSNSFFGASAGQENTLGRGNSFVGRFAGDTNTTGNFNTIIGALADVSVGDLTFATAIGANAVVSNSNSVVLGRSIDVVRIPGSLIVTGNVSKGGGSFKIDHPLDPLNKTLSHSFVESPDMMNIYNGNITLDARGRATVTLPAYFEALNSEFRYQLTAIGAPGPNLYIAAEIKGNHFKIAGGRAGMRVSWQVTGIRHDAFANSNRIPVEEDKLEQERGSYLHPGVFSQPKSTGVKQATEAELPRRTKGTRVRRPATARR